MDAKVSVRLKNKHISDRSLTTENKLPRSVVLFKTSFPACPQPLLDDHDDYLRDAWLLSTRARFPSEANRENEHFSLDGGTSLREGSRFRWHTFLKYHFCYQNPTIFEIPRWTSRSFIACHSFQVEPTVRWSNVNVCIDIVSLFISINKWMSSSTLENSILFTFV